MSILNTTIIILKELINICMIYFLYEEPSNICGNSLEIILWGRDTYI